MSRFRLHPQLVSITALIWSLGLAACEGALVPWGATSREAKRNADNAIAAFSMRFTNVQRDAKFAAARPRMGKYALIPSRLYRDSSIWTIRNAPDSSQALYLDATFENGRYLFSSRATAAYPRKLGDQRHYMRLRKVGGGDYEWVAVVDHGIGPVPASRLGNALGAFVTSFEGRGESAVLADVRGTFSHTTRHMGRLFRIDSLRTTVGANGATALVLAIAWQPDSIRRIAPAFAAYVDKYIVPSTYRIQLVDAIGATFLDVVGRAGGLVIKMRAHHGKLTALAGAPRAMPDSLQIILDASAKFKIFRVGFEHMVGDFRVERGEHERSLFMSFRREPKWHFPLAINQLIKSPLRAPFAGRGTELRLGIRDDLGSQTMSLRHMRTVVNESAIMRWLGNLGATAFGDFEASEAEENRFLAGMFEALRRDVAALQ